jgi:hypothetical protein
MILMQSEQHLQYNRFQKGARVKIYGKNVQVTYSMQKVATVHVSEMGNNRLIMLGTLSSEGRSCPECSRPRNQKLLLVLLSPEITLRKTPRL